jgi:sec-independent protein translocase protein TatA
MEGKIGLWEILLIVGIALLLFGPSKFASLGKSIGEGLRNFKSAVKEEPKKDEEEEKKS